MYGTLRPLILIASSKLSKKKHWQKCKFIHYRPQKQKEYKTYNSNILGTDIQRLL